MSGYTHSTAEAREARVRRAARKEGERIKKDRARTYSLDHQGGYCIVNDNNWIVAGEKFNLTLDELEEQYGVSA